MLTAVHIRCRSWRGLRCERGARAAAPCRRGRRRRASGTRTSRLACASGAEGRRAVGRPRRARASSRCNLPERYGGGGAGITELAIVGEEVAAVGCPLLTTLVSPAICGELLDALRDRAAARALATRARRRRRKMAFAITEPDAGSNSHRISTMAARDGDPWRVRGQKTFISFVDEADAVLVVVRTGTDDDDGRGRLSLLVVDTDAPGITLTPIPVEIAAARQAVPRLLRRRRGRPTIGWWATRARVSASSSTASTPSGSWAPRSATASAATRSGSRRRLRAGAQRLGRRADRRASGRRAPARRSPRSSSSSRGS